MPIDDRWQFEIVVRLPEEGVAASELIGERVSTGARLCIYLDLCGSRSPGVRLAEHDDVRA